MTSGFACRKCGDCCRGEGGVYLDGEGADRVAGLLGVGLDRLLAENFLEEAEPGLFLAKTGESDCSDGEDKCFPATPGTPGRGKTRVCVFLEENRCLIHAAKPPICRAWPFLLGLLRDEGSFLEARESCPGLSEITHRDFLEEFGKSGLPAPPASFGKALGKRRG
ncbi:MAG: YkgJ family cysteine cluster protein [Deltaproteobacteria bacterium]|nr:YkgJ family cysteine cluster protein [Deltaproteobacteria bacterium]